MEGGDDLCHRLCIGAFVSLFWNPASPQFGIFAHMLAQDIRNKPPHGLRASEPTDEETTGSLALVTLAGNEYRMPVDIEQYECLAQLEDDVVNFLPSVTNLDVFGCEVDLVRLDTQQPLRDPIQDTLRKHSRFQVIVRPCVEAHTWHFHNDNRRGYPKAVRVPVNDLGAMPDSAFYAAPTIRHVEEAQGLHNRSCGMAELSTAPVKSLPPGVSLGSLKTDLRKCKATLKGV